MNYISTKTFLKELDPNKKYCFILGAGASVSSDIPLAKDLAKEWLKIISMFVANLADYPAEIDRRIKLLNNGKDYERFKDPSYEPDLYSSLDDYSCICELCFRNDRNAERDDIFTRLDNKLPYIGYWALANVLTRTGIDHVITTNFDELIERAVRDYTVKQPMVINHEGIAHYTMETITHRCKIIMLHRSICTGGLNRTEELTALNSNWEKPITDLFKEYTPIVIGYAGTDNTLMPFLRANTEKGIYWCHLCGEIPHPGVLDLVETKQGKLVETIEFDHIMLLIASVLTEDKTFKKQIRGWRPDDIDQMAGYSTYKKRKVIKAVLRKNLDNEIEALYLKNLKKKEQPYSFYAELKCCIGNLYKHFGIFSKASSSFKKAFEHEQKRGKYFYKARYNYAVVQDEEYGPQKAAPIYRELCQKNPYEVKDIGANLIFSCALNNYCRTLIASGEYDEAYKYANRLYSMRRCDGGAHTAYAVASYYLHNEDAAMKAFDNAIVCYNNENDIGNKARAMLQRGMLYYKHGEIENAKSDLSYAKSNVPQQAAVHKLAKKY